jgi:hypothetical protein
VAQEQPAGKVVLLTSAGWHDQPIRPELAAFLSKPGNDFLNSLKAGRGFVLGFDDPSFDAQLSQLLPGFTIKRQVFPDAGGRAVVAVWSAEPHK